MEEQKTQLRLREDAKTALADWLATKVDKAIFTALSTTPTTDRIVYGGSATAESAIGTSDVMTTDLIGKAKRIATADENTMVKPIKVNGADVYVMVIDQWQARDLMADTKWIEAQKHANIRGEKNPIFTGALGMYNGVVLHVSNRILRTATGASSAKVGHALFLGAQAAVMAVGQEPEWNEDTFDYGNQVGFEFGRIFGIAKSAFKYDGTNLTDFGVINVLTSSADD
jgi:N4-gp56 family major capsid protein